ncbi:hypothetical protein [Kamptonema formosum]|uniref:hypothetical protein n=1 Tax=Kamptonema formosum TaxID=331992 RepID=UPI00035E3985|nr:hypothetical protein [Oscillatoria sp. PCC 10802]
MIRNRKGRDRRRAARSFKPVDDRPISGFPAVSGAPAAQAPLPHPVTGWGASEDAHPAALKLADLRRRRRENQGQERPKEPFELPANLQNLLASWQFWVGLSAIIFGGTGLIAMGLLLRLPTAPNCPSIFWPTASASLRMYCAQQGANKQTVDDLLRAIELINALPEDHPLRPEINRNIAIWAQQILDLSEKTFQEGKLDDAIAIARKVPKVEKASEIVDERINRWKSIWSEAEDIYKKAEASMRKQKWPQAFRQATLLLDVGNNYWATTKYEQINQQMKVAKEEGTKLNKAYSRAEQGGLENLAEAIKLARSISPKSYMYQGAQEAIQEFAGKMMGLAQERLEKRDLNGALEIARQIPDGTNLKEQVQDFTDLARAQALTWQDSVAGMEGAIAAAQKIAPNRPLYSKAQKLINEWQQSIEDLAYLEKARNLARSGSVSDLKSAITQVQLIKNTKPRYQQAQEEISRWQNQIEVQEDRPYLEKAQMLARYGTVEALKAAINEASKIGKGRALSEQAQQRIADWNREIQTQEDMPYLDRAEILARFGTIESLQAAIGEASKIGEGRALSEQARQKVQDWTRQVQQQEDQPYLDGARDLATIGKLSEAIEMAERIQPGRALYSEARETIGQWRDEIRGKQYLEDAYRAASSGTPDTLAAAIRTANQVSESSTLRSDAISAIGQWSQQMLAMAQERSEYDKLGAIEIAQQIPSYAPAYAAARAQIQQWEKQQNPPPPAAPAPPPAAPAAP